MARGAYLWFLGLVAGAIIFTWLFNSRQGSILMVALFHGTLNFATASSIENGLVAALLSMLVMVWAVVLVYVFKPVTLTWSGISTPFCRFRSAG
jgi:hypothetical protein